MGRMLLTLMLPILRFFLRKGPASIGAPVLAGWGCQMIYSGDLLYGFIALLLAGLWAIGAWLVSSELSKKKPRPLKSGASEARAASFRKALIKYRYWQFSIPSLIIAVLLLAGFFTHHKEIENELSKRSNFFLIPADDPTPANDCTHGSLFVFLGTMAATANKFPDVVLATGVPAPPGDPKAIDGRKFIPRLTIDRNSRGEVAVTFDIYDENENVVAAIEKNQVTISNDAFDVRRPDASTLTVIIKHKKETVLSARFLNKQAIRIYGHFRYPHALDVIASEDGLMVGGDHITGGCQADGSFAF